MLIFPFKKRLQSTARWASLCTIAAVTAASAGSGQVSPPAAPKQPTASVSAGSENRIVPPAPGYRYPNGETRVFSVEWHLFSAGNATVKLDAVGAQERVTVTGNSAGVVNLLYKVNDRFEAFFDPRTFCSLRISKHTEEGSHKRDTQVLFDYTRRKSILDEKNLKSGEVKHAENEIPNCVTDVVSGFYYLASLPLEPGNAHTFPMNDGGKTTEVTATVEAREQVKVPAGTYKTVRVKAEAISGSLKGRGTVWVWYSDDPRHLPVQMRSKLGWGTLLFRLQRVEKE